MLGLKVPLTIAQMPARREQAERQFSSVSFCKWRHRKWTICYNIVCLKCIPFDQFDRFDQSTGSLNVARRLCAVGARRRSISLQSLDLIIWLQEHTQPFGASSFERSYPPPNSVLSEENFNQKRRKRACSVPTTNRYLLAWMHPH